MQRQVWRVTVLRRCEPTNQTRVCEQTVGVVLLQTARQRARLRLAVDKEVGQSWSETHTHSKSIPSSAKITVPLVLNMGISDGKCDWNLEQCARVQTSRTLEVIALNVIRLLNGRLRCSAMTLLRMPRLVYILEWTRLKGNSPPGLFCFIYCLHKCLFTLLAQVQRHVKVEWGSGSPRNASRSFLLHYIC